LQGRKKHDILKITAGLAQSLQENPVKEPLRMRLELNLRVSQTVTPQMVLSMTMLQYSGAELEEYLETISYENPLMELQKPTPETSPDTFAQQLQWLRNGDRQNRAYYDPSELWQPEPAASQEQTLAAHLKEQILTMPLSRELRRCMEILVELLTPRGFFDGEIAEAARLSGCSLSLAQEALEKLKTLDPPGVGARGFQECMLLQLRRHSTPCDVACRLVQEHFEHLAAWPSQKLASAMGVSRQAVERARDLIAGLNPYPGDGFCTGEEIRYIRPDLHIYETAEGFAVRACEENAPTLSVNHEYLKMLRSEQDPEVQKYLRQKLSQLEQLMKNLKNRKSTMVGCAEIIARRQDAFLRGGSLTKMTLKDVAEEMGVHESTVSRTVRGKYIQCPRGIYEMSFFFSRSAGQNPELSRQQIMARLEQLISSEDPAQPFSDETLAALLAREHMVVSRRTVAKYRMELGILPASARKRKPVCL